MAFSGSYTVFVLDMSVFYCMILDDGYSTDECMNDVIYMIA